MILDLILIAFIGYLIGRIGDYFAGHWDFFHHWIYGILFIIIGIIFEVYFISFGIGLIVSDLKDMLCFKVFGPDEKTIKRFWGID
jgi:hypothetical protein